MRKVFAVTCALVLCMVFAACSGGAASSSASSSASDGAGSSSTAAAARSSAAAALPDGTYDIAIETDSSMVKVVSSRLAVKDGSYTVTMSLNGEGFSRLFRGKAEDAAKAAASDICDFSLNADGKYTFVFPIEALDQDTAIALFGQRRGTWYDHVLVFHAPTAEARAKGEGLIEGGAASASAGASVSAPAGASASAASSSATSGAANRPAEGDHTVGITLSGGSGRASIESPAKLVVSPDGAMTATIVWSSSNYDKMVVNGAQYLPVNTSGNSTFEIPVAAFDQDIAVQAETTAMSEPHMIDYTIRLDSSTLK